jgi:signal transduction histidine kinase
VNVLQKEDRGVVFEIIDNGCGMDEEIRKKLFAQFFSTKGSRGTGLGLLVTQKTIHEHGGSIDVESELGRGTKFIIKLPDNNPEYKK